MCCVSCASQGKRWVTRAAAPNREQHKAAELSRPYAEQATPLLPAQGGRLGELRQRGPRGRFRTDRTARSPRRGGSPTEGGGGANSISS
jgi:hypothetical protein